jgi:MA3 domain
MNYMDAQSPATFKELSSKASAAPSLPSISHEQGFLSPDECSKKMKKVLKEYFVGGDTADAVLSTQEMVNVGTEGSVERGAKAVEGGILMVMEMKEADVKKFLTLMESCVKDNKIESQAIVQGLNDPLEFLTDIEIDAPLAGSHLALIISHFLKWDVVGLGLLLSAPEYFRTDGKPAAFAIKILKKRGGDPTDEELHIIEQLMTDEEKATHGSAKAMFEAS